MVSTGDMGHNSIEPHGSNRGLYNPCSLQAHRVPLTTDTTLLCGMLDLAGPEKKIAIIEDGTYPDVTHAAKELVSLMYYEFPQDCEFLPPPQKLDGRRNRAQFRYIARRPPARPQLWFEVYHDFLPKELETYSKGEKNCSSADKPSEYERCLWVVDLAWDFLRTSSYLGVTPPHWAEYCHILREHGRGLLRDEEQRLPSLLAQHSFVVDDGSGKKQEVHYKSHEQQNLPDRATPFEAWRPDSRRSFTS